MSWAAAIGAVGSAFGASRQNKANAREAALSRQFNERLSRNKYQYEAQDLKKAGLNRILAVTQGATAGSSSAQARHENVGEAAIQGSKLGLLRPEIANINQDTELKNSAKSLNQAQAFIKSQEALINEAAIAESGISKDYYNSATGRYLHMFGKGLDDTIQKIPGIGLFLGGKGKGKKGNKGKKKNKQGHSAKSNMTKKDWKNKQNLENGINWQ